MPVHKLVTGYDHVAYATRNTDATVALLTTLGFVLAIYKRKIDRFNVYITKMVSAAGHVAEIVEPSGPRSVVSGILENTEATVYHACFLTQDFHATHRRLRDFGAVSVTNPMRIPFPVTPAHEHFLASHMFHSSLGMFEVTGPVISSATMEAV
jgi:4-hydroxyphenylpyruvate dioxygenase-like putative hemolysin